MDEGPGGFAVIDEPTTTVTFLRPLRDPKADHFDPDQTSTPKTVATGVRANVSVPSTRFTEGTRTATTYRWYCDPTDCDGNEFTVRIGDVMVDDRTRAKYSLGSALLRSDADYPDDLGHSESLSHWVGDATAVKGVAVGI